MENERKLEHIIPEGQIEVWPSLRVENPIFRPSTPIDPNAAECIDTRLFEIRSELTQIEQPITQTEPTLIEGLPPVSDSPAGLVREKQMLRRKKELKDKQPQGYTHKMLVVSDLQLLQETNEPAVGALLKYVQDQGHTFSEVVLNGDIIDFQQQGGFRKDNQLGDSVTQDEQVAGRWFIDFMKEHTPNARSRIFMKGNHEARYANMYLDTNNGVQQYLRPFEEVFGLEKWDVREYGQGESYEWVTGRKVRHGTKGGAITNIPKIEMERSWRPTTVGHAITNRMWEHVDADGNSYTSFVHAGFSSTAHYDKSGDKKPSNGFGIYFASKVRGKWVENAYQVIMPANNPIFISPEGNMYDGTNFSLRETIGLEVKRGRGRPKSRGSV